MKLGIFSKPFSAIVPVLILLLFSPLFVQAGFERFITAEGTSLMDGDEEFRFIAFNVPTLLYVEDEMAFSQPNPYGLPAEFELRDLYQTVVEMGGRVVRAYTIPVRNRHFPAESITYIEGPGEFNEEAFKAMDLALALAAEYDIRVVIPLLNNWQWMGGRPDYAAFRGKTSDEFWTDRQLIEDFKKTITYVLNRVNTITGVQYKDDKTIMAWETGNELQNTAAWAMEIGAFIKRIDRMIIMMTFTMRAGSSYYYFNYYVERPELLSNYLFWQMIAYAGGALLAPVMTQFIDKAKLLMILMSIVGVLSILFFFVPKDMIWAMFTLNIMISLALGPKSPLTWSMYADAADYNEWRNSRRATAMTFSAATFAQKLGGSLGSAGMLWVLAAIGYAANEAQSGASQTGIALLQTAIPGLFALIAVFVLRYYTLTGSQLEKIQAELKARYPGDGEDAVEARS